MNRIIKKKVFIVGSNGFLGSNIKNNLKKNKFYNLLTNNSKKIDFSNTKICKKTLTLLKPDIIINCAAKTNIEFCEKNKKITYNSNVKIVKNLTDYVKTYNCKLIHISTDHVYNSKFGYSSEAKKLAINYYAKSKLLGENYAIKSNAIILRTNFFGLSNKKGNLINWIVKSAKKREKIFLYDNIFFSPLNIKTLVKIIIKILNSNKRGIYNLGSKNKISKSLFILKIAKKLKIKLNYKIINYEPLNFIVKRPKDMSMNIRKFQKTFRTNLPTIESEINKLFIK